MGALHETDRLLETYRHLRMILVALAVLLLVGTALGLAIFGTVATSISASYAGPLRNVFVGAMVGIGACLVAFKGRALEDYSLNHAGFYAMFVAFVPSNLSETLHEITDDELRQEASDTVLLAVLAILLVGVVFFLVDGFSKGWTDPMAGTNAKARFLYWVSWAMFAVFVVLLGARLLERAEFAGVHGIAAVFMILNLAIAAACNGWPDAAGETGLPGYRWYRWIALAMVPGALVPFLVAQWSFPEYRVAVIEWWSVGLFAAFWMIETVRRWDNPVRAGGSAPPEKAAADDLPSPAGAEPSPTA